MQYRTRSRYKVKNINSDDNGRFLTIVRIETDIVYYKFDGQKEIYSFEIGSIFEQDLVKVS